MFVNVRRNRTPVSTLGHTQMPEAYRTRPPSLPRPPIALAATAGDKLLLPQEEGRGKAGDVPHRQQGRARLHASRLQGNGLLGRPPGVCGGAEGGGLLASGPVRAASGVHGGDRGATAGFAGVRRAGWKRGEEVGPWEEGEGGKGEQCDVVCWWVIVAVVCASLWCPSLSFVRGGGACSTAAACPPAAARL